MDWTVRPLVKTDVEQLAKLQLRVFSRKRELQEVIQHFTWKYFNNPYGDVIGSVAVAADNSIIGMYGSVPLKLKLNNEEIIANYVVTTAVEEKYRNQSILKSLYQCFKEEIVKSKNSSVCFGFPNPLAYKIGKKSLEYNHIFKIYTYKIPLKLETKLSLEHASNLKTKLYNQILRKVISPLIFKNKYQKHHAKFDLEINAQQKIPEDFTDFWNFIAADYEKIVVREKKYLEWRIFNEPEKKNVFYTVRENNKLIGYFVINYGYVTVVNDFLVKRDREVVKDVFLRMLEIISQNKKAAVVRFPIYDEYLELALLDERAQISDVSAFVNTSYKPSDLKYFEIFNHPSNWYLSGNEYLIA